MKDCNQCGKCCIHYGNGGLTATPAEIDYWQRRRPEIAEYVVEGEIWCDPETGKRLTRCPWLKLSAMSPSDKPRYACSIYQDRPADCRHYPATIEQMKYDECEMLDEGDRLRPKMAQRRLDKMMYESRIWTVESLE